MLLYYSLFLINVFAFAITAYDKHLAITHKNRISEKKLLTWVFVGGAVGAGLAMLIFNHKTSKENYLLKFWGIVLLQFFILLGLFYFKIWNF